MNKTCVLYLVVVAVLAFAAGSVWHSNKPVQHSSRSSLGAPLQLKRVNCMWDVTFAQKQINPSACFSALSNYLTQHPEDRIMGVLPLELEGLTTAFVIIHSDLYGRLARDLTVDLICTHLTSEKDCLSVLGTVELYDSNALSWLVINGHGGIDSVLRLQVRPDAELPGSWDGIRWETGAQ